MTNHITLLDELERRIPNTGLAGIEPQLEELADLLSRRGELPAIAGIIADPGAPEVVRMRAIGRAAAALRRVPAETRELVAAV